MHKNPTFVSDLMCVALHLVMFIVLTAAPVLQFLHLSPWSRLRKAFSEQNERTPPLSVCFLLCVHLPVINDCSASLTEAATTKTPERHKIEKNLKEKDEQKAAYCTSELELELISLENLRGGRRQGGYG